MATAKAPLPSQLYATLNRCCYSGNKQCPIFPVPPQDLDSPLREEENMSPNLLYALILVAAVAHATWNALVKSATDRLLTMAAIRLVGLLFGLAVLPFVPWPSDTALIWLGLACGANFAYHGLLIQSYRVGDLSLVYPLARGSAPVLLALTAFMAIDERLGPAQIAAVILITGGILALVIGKGRTGRPSVSRWRRESPSPPTPSLVA
jgi:drug/metabolite transporter (DMT)-like permease